MEPISRPTLFLLHALGMSGREWELVMERLGETFDCIALDLPGFGGAADNPRRTVEEMADWLADAIRSRNPANWMIAGHSMGGKLATLVAARARDGEHGLSGLVGVVLVAASPPAPEPIDEARRAEMIEWWRGGPIQSENAAKFVDANTAAKLDGPLRDQAIAVVCRSAPDAWIAWLERGSREDWTEFAGQIAVPALIVAGAQDGDLGVEAQHRLNAPHYTDHRVETVAGAAHLIPYEQPAALAHAIEAHWHRCAPRALPDAFARTLASERVSRRTRAAMLARISPPTDQCFDQDQRKTLAALVECVLPGAGGDMPVRIEAALANGESDGWRFADLPPDITAWRQSLDALSGFADLATDKRQARLEAIAQGDDRALSRWFEDMRAEAVRIWLSLPHTMARIGWDGFANGGDGIRKEGYHLTAADVLEPWQPRVRAS